MVDCGRERPEPGAARFADCTMAASPGVVKDRGGLEGWVAPAISWQLLAPPESREKLPVRERRPSATRRAEIRAGLEAGSRLECSKSQQAFDDFSAWAMKFSSPGKPERRNAARYAAHSCSDPKTASGGSMTGAAVALLSWVLRPISLMG